MSYAVDYALVDGNAPPDCAKAVAFGARTAIIRAAWGYHGAAHVDRTIARDATAWRAAGAQVGAYLFLDYDTDPIAQADTCHMAYARQPGDFPVALDLETDVPPPGTTAASRVAFAERALARLQQHYGQHGVWIYTSLQQWLDHFGDLDSPALGACPLWIKTPYAWKARNPPKLADVGPLGALPRPWRRAGSPGAWMQQFQGDALGWPGCSSTVDLSVFLPYSGTPGDARSAWLAQRIGTAQPLTVAALQTWQRSQGLTSDGIAGPRTFAALCR